MKRALSRLSIPVLVAGSVIALGGASSPSEEVAPVAAPAPIKERITAPRRGVQQLWDLDLRRWPEERFYENFSHHVDLLSQTHGIESTLVLMDVAELYLGQMMIFEAGSVLDSIDAVGADQDRRLMALRHARDLLSGQGVEDFAQSPLAAETRPDRAFWSAMQGIATADAALLTKNLETGLLGLIYQTRPVARTVVPLLTEALIEVGKDDVAGQALRLLDDFPEIANGPTGHYLRGRADQLKENDSSALAAYFEAAKGWDRYAVRGRLALADMALADGGRGALLAAQDVLEFGADAWRGDFLEIEVLRRLATVYSQNRETIGALQTRGKIMMRFPGTESAKQAEQEATADLSELYKNGSAGEIPLSHWMNVHYQLVPAFRYYSAFPDYVERMGDHLLTSGGTALAAREYQRALDLRRDLTTLYPDLKDESAIFDLQMKLANALTKGGQLESARDLLMALNIPPGLQKRERVNKLRAKVLARLGDSDALLRTHVRKPSAENLRNVGRTLWENNDWEEAVTFYSRLWAEYPGQFDVGDATYLLIASHRAGDAMTSEKVVSAFPKLTESEDWRMIAKSFLEMPPAVLPLTRNAADERIERLKNSLGHIEGSGL